MLILSYNDESWIALDDLLDLCASRGGRVVALAFDSARYVGAQIGVHNPAGERVGEVSHLRNLEYVLVCGDAGRRRARDRALRRRSRAHYAEAAIIRPRSRNDGVAAPSVNSACFTQRK